jgi:hypothetical protein
MEISYSANGVMTVKIKTGQLRIGRDGGLTVTGNQDQPVVITGPGEYEAFGFSITGLGRQTFVIEAEEIRLGYQTITEPVQVLFTASGEAIKEAAPNLVIPVTPAAAADLIKTSGLEPKTEKKLTISKLSLPEETELVILESQ